MHGHLLGAAGCVEAIATVLAIQNGVVPPTINHFADDPNIPQLDFTFNKPVNRDITFALSTINEPNKPCSARAPMYSL